MYKWVFYYALQILLVIQALLIWIAVIKKQKFAFWILISGIAVFFFLALMILIGTYFDIPRRPHNLYIYQIFFLSVMLTVAGLIGLLTKFLTGLLTKMIFDKKSGNNKDNHYTMDKLS
jgi:hypothetical protein